MRNRIIASARRVRAAVVTAAAVVQRRVGLEDVIFSTGLLSLSIGVYQVYAPAAPIVAGIIIMWAALPPAPPARTKGAD
jgi:hypothetical protein